MPSRARCRARPQPGPPQRPDRERHPADPGGGQQPRRRRARKRDLRALARTDPRRRAPGDEREQRNVAGQRRAFERHSQHRPRGAHIEPAPQSVGERMYAAAGQQDDGERRPREQRGNRGAPRQRTDVDGRERKVGDAVFGGEHRYEVYWRAGIVIE